MSTSTPSAATTTAQAPAAAPENPGAEPESGGRLRLAVVVGSVREGRFGPVVADWFAGEARAHGGYDVDVIDLADAGHTLPLALPGPGAAVPQEAARVRSGLAARLAAADAFVLVTPEYNHSYPAALKNLIDWFRDEWRAKPVGFASYGGMSGGLRAVEHLRQVFPELHAVTVRNSLSFHMAWERFDADGRPHDAEGCATAAKDMLRQLAWWGSVLRDARLRTPATVL